MLVRFSVSNYKSIKEQITVDFTASSLSDHMETNVVKESGENLLKTVLLYGSNASGKSKILDALVVFRGLILESGSYNSKKTILVEPFLLNTETIGEPSSFEAEFIVGGKRYRYGFLADRKSFPREWLVEVKKTTQNPVFLRIGQALEIDHKRFENAQGLEKRVGENSLFLSVADQWNVPVAKAIYGWFYSIFTVHGMMDEEYRDYTNDLSTSKKYRKMINQMMQKADLGINSVDVSEITEELRSESLKRTPEDFKDRMASLMAGKFTPVLTRHNILDKKGKLVRETEFDLQGQESEGTKKFYNIIGLVLYAVLNDRLVVIDELDARLHTLLSKSLIRLFNGEFTKTKAQIFGVSHDTALLDRNLLRRDQIYFVEKDQHSATKITNLAAYKLRKDTPFDKNYLEGRYGAIPMIENLENVFEHGQ